MPEPSGLNRAGGDTIDAENDSDTDPSGFALSVDLSACVGAPACCRVWVRRRARKVRWLASRVRRAARLKGRLLLLAGEHLLPPSEPLRMLRPDDTLRVTRVEHEWQQAFSFEDSDEDAPPPAPTLQPPNHNANIDNSPIKIKQSKKSAQVTNTSIVPSFKRKFTVGDTLFLLNQEAQHTQRQTEQVTEHPSESEQSKETSEVGYVQKSTTTNHESSPNVDHDALNRVKRRALELLEGFTEEKEADVVDAPKKKRRRVRRRRPAKLLPEETIEDSETVEIGLLKQNNHIDLTKQVDTDSKTQQTLLEHISPSSQDVTEDQDIELIKSNGDSPAQLNTSTPDTIPTAQPSPMWVMEFAELPIETQVPVLVRNTALPRAPRVVRALDNNMPILRGPGRAPSLGLLGNICQFGAHQKLW